MARAALPLAAVAFAGAVLALAGCRSSAPASAREVAVKVGLVATAPDASESVIVLQEEGGPRALPISIGLAEAQSIATEMEHRRLPRPDAHDLAAELLGSLEAAVQRAVVTDLRDGTYYAVLVIGARGRVFEVDARPSDAIALALRCGAPVFVREPLFDSAPHEAPPAEDERST